MAGVAVAIPELAAAAEAAAGEIGAVAGESGVLQSRLQQWTAVEKHLGNSDKAKQFFDAFGTLGLDAKETKEPDGPSESEQAAARARELLQEQKLNLGIQDRTKLELGIPVRPPGYGAAYLNNDWTIKSIGGVDNPTTLKADAWNTIVSTTKAMYGFVLFSNGTLAKARYPAFEFKNDNGSKTTIPAFEVFDDSQIEIKESNTQFEHSLVTNGSSSNFAQAGVSVGAFGIAVAASGGFTSEHQNNEANGTFSDTKQYTASYSFPRARVFLDELDLQLTPECAAALTEVRKAAKVVTDNLGAVNKYNALRNALAMRDQFYKKYGQMFVTSFQLGGQLTESKFANPVAGSTETDKRDAMKWAAAVSVDSKYVSTQASGGRETNDDKKTRDVNLQNTSALAWSARGGNTLLCANPAEWANSIAGFQTWRAIEQDGIYAMPTLIGKLTTADTSELPWADIPGLFDAVNKNAFQQVPAVPPGTWTGKITLETWNGGRRLIVRDGMLRLTDEGDNATKGHAFSVFDANWDSRNAVQPLMPELYRDWPLFLVAGDNTARDPNLGSQIPGIWVDAAGNIRTESDPNRLICRWSLHSVGMDLKNTWQPNAHSVIADGSDISLHCHSHYSGAYRSVDSPPYFAPNVHTKSDGSVKVVKCEGTALNVPLSLRLDKNQPPISEHLWAESSDEYSSHIGFLWPGSMMQSIMERFDKGQETDFERYQIENFRKFYGVHDEANCKSLLGWVSFLRSARNPSRDVASARDQFVPVIQGLVPSAIWESWQKWDDDNGGFADTRFIVRYVYDG